MIAIIAGATGLTGTALLQELAQNPSITTIRALVRTPGKLPKHPKLEEILLPPLGFTGLSKTQDPKLAGDLYFCALGTTIKKAGSQAAFREVDLDAVVEFATLCAARGGRYFGLVSSTGANSQSLIFYSRVKGEAEAAISKLGIPRVCFVRPSFLIGDRTESRPAERMAIQSWRTLASILPRPLRTRLGSPIEKVAQLLVKNALVNEPGRAVFEASEIE
jgi:uncharacterized protein YbjT (DUF2867 family)